MRASRPLRKLITAALLLPGIAGVAAACRSNSGTVAVDGPILSNIPLPAEVSLAPGGSIDLATAGLRFKFETVVDDSRCPATVMCVWAGAAVLRFTVSQIVSLESARAVTLSTEPGKDTATVYGQPVRLLRVEPARAETAPIPLASYRAVLKIGTQ